MTNYERRTISGDIEFRGEHGGVIRAAGYAAKFGTLSQNLGGFVETIRSGTFNKTLQEADVRALFNHDPNLMLGRNRSGTLRMEEDAVGLAFELDLPDTTLGHDVAVLLERGDVTGSSFGFRTIEDDWSETPEGFPLRELRSVALRDIGPVTFPAYTDTESSLRHLAEARGLPVEGLQEAVDQGHLLEYLAEERPLDALRAEEESPEEDVAPAEADEKSRANPTPLSVVRERKLRLLGR